VGAQNLSRQSCAGTRSSLEELSALPGSRTASGALEDIKGVLLERNSSSATTILLSSERATVQQGRVGVSFAASSTVSEPTFFP
jgi:hypothetical protein